MPTIPERIREVVSSEGDDFFGADTVLYYANKSKDKVFSYCIKQEQQMDRSLRALDDLRLKTDISVNGLTFNQERDYYYVDIDFPSTDTIRQFNYLTYKDDVPLKEITQNQLSDLKWGNLEPNEEESYYLVTNDGTNKQFRVYWTSDDSSTSNSVNIYYYKEPTNIQGSDTDLTDMPDQLENAVIYGAAVMMILQESVKDPNNQSQLFNQLYQEELQSNIY